MRLRLRTLLICVALVAFLFAWGLETQRWYRCRHRALVAAVWKESYRETGDAFKKRADTYAALARGEGLGENVLEVFRRQEESNRVIAEEYRALSDWSGRMQAMYDEAKTRPWRRVPPGVPAPPPASRSGIRAFGWD